MNLGRRVRRAWDAFWAPFTPGPPVPVPPAPAAEDVIPAWRHELSSLAEREQVTAQAAAVRQAIDEMRLEVQVVAGEHGINDQGGR